MLQIHNSLTRQKQPFVPLEAGKVRMYVCGMTVYDYCHIGHARVMVVFDVICRWLRASGYQVQYVRNITDIDDKIIRRARENGEPIQQLTDRFIRFMQEDAAALGVEQPDHEPRATTHVEGMLRLIDQLMRNGLAYRAGNGDVYYSVRRFPPYGKLSGKSLEDLRAGERVEVDTNKQDPLDFVLWKAAKPEEPAWESPWGPGRPGWHIECSAMSEHFLGEHFDIHGGGQDLLFPHHENEIAQSEGAHGHPFVNYWVHNGFVRVDNEKMSKSLGNFFTVRDVLARYDPEVVRFFIVRAHYRSPLNYSDQHLDDARAGLTRLYTALKDCPKTETISIDWNSVQDGSHAGLFKKAMDDDFNTAEALAVLSQVATELNIAKQAMGLGIKTENEIIRQARDESAALLRTLGGLLGLLQRDPVEFLQSGLPGADIGIAPEEIEQLIEQRAAARKSKQFAEADRIRKELEDRGVLLEDTAAGTLWRRR